MVTSGSVWLRARNGRTCRRCQPLFDGPKRDAAAAQRRRCFRPIYPDCTCSSHHIWLQMIQMLSCQAFRWAAAVLRTGLRSRLSVATRRPHPQPQVSGSGPAQPPGQTARQCGHPSTVQGRKHRVEEECGMTEGPSSRALAPLKGTCKEEGMPAVAANLHSSGSSHHSVKSRPAFPKPHPGCSSAPPASAPAAGCSGCAPPCPAAWQCRPGTRLRGKGGERGAGLEAGRGRAGGAEQGEHGSCEAQPNTKHSLAQLRHLRPTRPLRCCFVALQTATCNMLCTAAPLLPWPPRTRGVVDISNRLLQLLAQVAQQRAHALRTLVQPVALAAVRRDRNKDMSNGLIPFSPRVIVQQGRSSLSPAILAHTARPATTHRALRFLPPHRESSSSRGRSSRYRRSASPSMPASASWMPFWCVSSICGGWV